MKDGCFFTPNGEHVYKGGNHRCELCGEPKKRGQGLYRRNIKKSNKDGEYPNQGDKN